MNKKHLLLLSVISILALSSCKKIQMPSSADISVTRPSDGFIIHTDAQLALINSSDPNALVNSDIRYGRVSLSKPNGLHLSWGETNDINQEADKYEILFSEDEAFSNPVVYTTENKEIDIYNLKINTKYYYRVDSIHHTSRFSSSSYEYTVTDVAPRNIYVDGVENVRDLGGWTLANNKTYKQGLIYRTAQFNYGGGLNTYKSAPTEVGVNSLLNELKIKTEIDLRKTKAFNGEDEVNSITSSPLGESVNYVSCPMIYANTNIFTNAANKASIQAFFTTLSDINNYPVAFHCLRGTDRTGALAYMLGALVGMSQKDLELDYLFSDMANIGSPVTLATISGDDFYVKGINDSEGDSLSEKAKNYLMSTCEVSEATINTVISILSA